MIRILGVLLSTLGFYLLFVPFIVELSWIPLVNSFLASSAAAAAFSLAIIAGMTSSIAIAALAWVFYRPLMGISMLTLVSISIYFTFYYEQGAN